MVKCHIRRKTTTYLSFAFVFILTILQQSPPKRGQTYVYQVDVVSSDEEGGSAPICFQDEGGFLHNCNNSTSSDGGDDVARGLFYPKACSMNVAYDMISKFKVSSPMGREFLPLMDFSECDRPREEVDVLLGMLLPEGRVKDPFMWSHWWSKDIMIRTQNQQTLGKKVDWYTKKALLAYLKSSDANSKGPPKPWPYKSNETHWAGRLHCANQTNAWDCNFGNASATANLVAATQQYHRRMDPYSEEMNTTRLLWNMRPCISNINCGEADPHHVKVLLLGWMYRYTLPMNACEANYRLHCSKNIVSLRNLNQTEIALRGGGTRVFLSIHMRMGDACDRVETEERLEPFVWGRRFKDRPCIAPVGYEAALKRMTKLYGVTDILLASDSDDAFKWAKQLTTHDVHYLEVDRSKLDTHAKDWIEKRTDIGHTEIDSSIQEMNFLGNGQMLIGGSCGKFTKVIYSIMVGRQNSVLPWVSVDGCHCFHSDDHNSC